METVSWSKAAIQAECQEGESISLSILLTVCIYMCIHMFLISCVGLEPWLSFSIRWSQFTKASKLYLLNIDITNTTYNYSSPDLESTHLSCTCLMLLQSQLDAKQLFYISVMSVGLELQTSLACRIRTNADFTFTSCYVWTQSWSYWSGSAPEQSFVGSIIPSLVTLVTYALFHSKAGTQAQDTWW